MIVGTFFIIPFSPLITFLILLFAPFTLVGLKSYLKVQVLTQKELDASQYINQYLPKLTLKNTALIKNDQTKFYKGFCTNDSIESNTWKLKLLENAQENIVLSGCYCGGKVFDRALSIIEEKLSSNHKMQVYILSSDIWITSSNRKKINYLQKVFPDRFSATIVKEKSISIDPNRQKVQVSCNHIKALVIDYGRYFIIGGSGFQDRWFTHKGDESISIAAVPFYKKLTQDAMAPVSFRDSDYVFSSTESYGIGRQIFLDLIQLITKWQTVYKSNHYAILDFIGKDNCQDQDVYIPEIESHPELIENISIAAFLSGPDTQRHRFYETLIEEINHAKSHIAINHMYFHPSKDLLSALANASLRGVKIDIITNSNGKNSPGLNGLFVALSKQRIKKLVDEGEVENIHVYSFECHNVTLHKKIIIIDKEKVLSGSSNIGFTSMTSSADFEMDLIITSNEFAKHTLEKVQVDQFKCSKKLSNQEISTLSFKNRILAPFQSNLEFLL